MLYFAGRHIAFAKDAGIAFIFGNALILQFSYNSINFYCKTDKQFFFFFKLILMADICKKAKSRSAWFQGGNGTKCLSCRLESHPGTLDVNFQ